MNGDWRERPVLLGVTAGVAAYKAVMLASMLAREGALVDVVMTPAAQEFVRPLQFSAITGRAVYSNQWNGERKPEHIALAERPDIVVIAPCTANTMAKLAGGIADNLLTSVLLATKKPVLIAPAMNTGMWTAPATRRNLRTLLEDGVETVGPGTGRLACGYDGEGRMADPDEIVAAMARVLAEKNAREEKVKKI